MEGKRGRNEGIPVATEILWVWSFLTPYYHHHFVSWRSFMNTCVPFKLFAPYLFLPEVSKYYESGQTHTRTHANLIMYLNVQTNPACFSQYRTHEIVTGRHEGISLTIKNQYKNGGQTLRTKNRKKKKSKNTYDNKKRKTNSTTRYKPSIFQMAFFSSSFFRCQNNRMNKSRGLTSFRPSWLQKWSLFSWQQAGLLLYSPFRFTFCFTDDHEVLWSCGKPFQEYSTFEDELQVNDSDSDTLSITIKSAICNCPPFFFFKRCQ